jgi:NTE family protein
VTVAGFAKPDDHPGAAPATAGGTEADREPAECPPSPPGRRPLAIVLSGGGARAAYQVGLLRCLARHLPALRFDIVTGVSAGAINAAFLAAHPGNLVSAAEELSEIWSRLEVDEVFRVDPWSLGHRAARAALRLVSGGARVGPGVRGMVDTAPLDRLIERVLPTEGREVAGIARNLAAGRLRALALTTLDYSTGQTITWIEGCDIEDWERPNRRSVSCRITVDHVMASAALPLFFPAVKIGRHWHGDGGIRLAAPLSPAVHLGAGRILAISTRYPRTHAEAERSVIAGYPPPAQILGALLNAVFLDVIDQDVVRLERFNRLLERLPEEERGGLRPIDCLVLRPSEDLGRLAAGYEPRLPKTFRFLTRGLGTRETESPDFLSLILFQADYLTRLIEIGEADAERHLEQIAELVSPA